MKTTIQWGLHDKSFYSSKKLGNLDFETKIFSGGEIQVRLNLPETVDYWAATINAYIKNSNDLMELLLLTNALKKEGFYVNLICPYLPYARQDRVCYNGEAFSLEVIADVINSQKYEIVEVWDVHSDVALKLINKIKNIPADKLLPHRALSNNPVFVAPDKGAYNRVSECAKAFETIMVQAEKIRNPDNGEITGTIVYGLENLSDKANYLIIDDICDGGKTFIELAKVLKQSTTGNVSLYVTHGIFSKGFNVFKGLIDNIYVANCFVDNVPNFVYVGVS